MTYRLSMIALGVALAAAAPLAGAQAAGEDTLVVARDTDFNSLDPSRSWCDSCQIYLTAAYEPLVRVGADDRTLEPRLAASWSVSEDGKTYTFALNPKAVFSDGSPVEAGDVAWSLLRLKNLKEGPSFFADGIEAIATPDAHTAVVTLAAPDPEFLGKMSTPYAVIMNSDVVAEHGGAAGADASSVDRAESWLLENSAGSGPFVLESYRPDDQLRLARNESYWGDRPAVAGVVIRTVKDAVAQRQLLESGGADVAMQIDADTAESMSDPSVVTELVPSYNFVYVALAPGAANSPVPLTPKVREAIGLALDYEGILEFTTGGKADLQATAIPNGFPGTDGLALPAQDVEKAKALLAEAGHPDGFAIDAVYPELNVYGVDLSVLMQKVQQDLAKVGITVDLEPVTFAVWADRMGAATIPMTALFYAPDYYGSGQYTGYFSMVPGARWYDRAGGDAVEGLKNDAAVALIGRLGTASPEAAAGIYHELGQEMIDDRIIFPLVNPKLVLAYRKGVDGVRYAVCCNLPLDELSKN